MSEDLVLACQGLGKTFSGGGLTVPVLQDVNLEAVSYTHLDVYKRQIARMPVQSSARGPKGAGAGASA